jgi:hypothetical protein
MCKNLSYIFIAKSVVSIKCYEFFWMKKAFENIPDENN